MPGKAIEALGVLIDAFTTAAAKDPRVRQAARTVATTLLEWVESIEREARESNTPDTAASSGNGSAGPVSAQPTSPGSISTSPSHPTTQPPHHPTTPITGPRAIVPLRLGDDFRTVPVRGTADEILAAADARPPTSRADLVAATSASAFPAPADLSLVSKRSALKAQACRWGVERRQRMAGADPEDFEALRDHDSDLFARAKAIPNCYLWMMDPRGIGLPADELAMIAAGCYDALAAAVELLCVFPDTARSEPAWQDALYFVAEAQSALRAAMEEVSPTLWDGDQRDVFFWLRRQTSERGIYISRHMRIDDTANPREWQDLQARIASARAAADQRRQQRKSRQTLLNKARYHAARAFESDGSPSMADWETLSATVEEIIRQNIPASDIELREILLPLLDSMPDIEIGPGLRAVLGEADRYLSLADGNGAAKEESARDRGPAAEVLQVRQLLQGKKAVLIGGVPRPHARAALEKSFALDELVWVTTIAHQSPAEFEPIVCRPDTALVILAIRWSSHSFGDVKAMCDRCNKPFVRLPAGYNPDQVARQVLQQCSQALHGALTV